VFEAAVDAHEEAVPWTRWVAETVTGPGRLRRGALPPDDVFELLRARAARAAADVPLATIERDRRRPSARNSSGDRKAEARWRASIKRVAVVREKAVARAPRTASRASESASSAAPFGGQDQREARRATPPA